MKTIYIRKRLNLLYHVIRIDSLENLVVTGNVQGMSEGTSTTEVSG